MRILTYYPIETDGGGGISDDDIVFEDVNGRLVARKWSEVCGGCGSIRNPQSAIRNAEVRSSSPDQQTTKVFFRTATQNWQYLSELDRRAWQRYAERYFTTTAQGKPIRPNGFSVYVKVACTRQILGMGLPVFAPKQAPPRPLKHISLMVSGDARDYCFRLTHSLRPLKDYGVLVSITPAMPSRARRPAARQLCLIKGVGAASSVQLVRSGETISFREARFAIGNGQRFGFEARVVRIGDCMTSTPVFRDVVRMLE